MFINTIGECWRGLPVPFPLLRPNNYSCFFIFFNKGGEKKQHNLQSILNILNKWTTAKQNHFWRLTEDDDHLFHCSLVNSFLFPVILFLVHALVSMWVLDGCAVFNVSHDTSSLFQGPSASRPHPLCFCLFFTLQHAYWMVSRSLLLCLPPSVQAFFGSCILLNDSPHCGVLSCSLFWLCAQS